MWIVRLALDRPYTFIVVAILITIFGTLSVSKMPVDIFPRINIPVLTAVWNYGGLSPRDMERRIISVCERASQVTVSGIDHIESLSLPGMGVVRVYLRQEADQRQSLSELTAVCQAILRMMPPGETPPFTTAISATDIPVMQLVLSSDTVPETKLFDFANNFLRSQVNTVPGASMPWPYGGAHRQVMIDIDPEKLIAKGISAADVSKALAEQNLILPAGTAKLGDREYFVNLNSSPESVNEMSDIPVKLVDNAMVLLKDVATVRDGTAVQTNIVNENGARAVLENIIKLGGASTIDVVNGIKKALPNVESILPEGVQLRVLNDQSIFVRESVDDVIKEGLIAAGLTAVLMLLLLGDWRSTVIVAISIPLSVLSGFIVLVLCAQTLNVMTLGGFALAVGMLVDDATVEVENIHRHLDLIREKAKELESAGERFTLELRNRYVRQGILDAAMEIATPAFVSTVSICIVFAPVLLLTEPARSMFSPLALAVVGSMMASWFLSRTVVPVMARYLLANHADPGYHHQKKTPPEFLINRIHGAVNGAFEAIRSFYSAILIMLMSNPLIVAVTVALFLTASGFVLLFMGADFFPSIDGTVVRMHVSAPRGMRVEETEHLVKEIEAEIRKLIPESETEGIADIMGIPNSGINLSSSDSVNYTSADAEILITLKHDHEKSCRYYRHLLRDKLPGRFPHSNFFFQPSDIVTQILNAGLAAPIDIQVRCFDIDKAYRIAQKINEEVKTVPGAIDVHIKQSMDSPVINVEVDRQKAALLGLTQRDVADSMLVSLSSSFQTSPNFWLNPKNGVSYNLAVQTPQRMVSTMADLENTVISGPQNGSSSSQILSNLATFSRSREPSIVNHYNTQPVIDVLASVDGADLYTVAQKVEKIVEANRAQLPKGVFIDLRGQMVSMYEAYQGILIGLAFAILLVYLLLVVNFQSWTDPLIILMAIPGALSGAIWALFLTQTNLCVPALMGAMMSIGVASANSILVVSFAREKLNEGYQSADAAIIAATTRFRPVLMTALAMIVGMVPMAIGSGSGGALNAPLGRAVIGGLVVATFFTLIWVPLVFSIAHRRANRTSLNNTHQLSGKSQV